MERVLVTGATGFVGSNVVKAAEGKYEVVPTSLHPFDAMNYSVRVMDVGSKEDCQKVIKAEKPDLVVHCAAYLDLVGCERKNAQARAVNVGGTINLREACKSVGAFLLFVSTDWVFDGTKPFGQLYSESDAPLPVNGYGELKLESERALQKESIEWAVVRPANIYGCNLMIPRDVGARARHFEEKGSWAMKQVLKLRRHERVRLPDDLYQTPTYAGSLATSMIRLYEKSLTGIFHVSGKQCSSRYEFAKELAREFGLDGSLVDRGDTDDFVRSLNLEVPIRFPRNVCLDVSKIENVTGTTMLNLHDGLRLMRNDAEELQARS